jgi:hypothetical protein
LILYHLGLDAEFRSEGSGQVALETNQPLGFLRVGIDVRRAAFGIRAPGKNPAGFDLSQVVSGGSRQRRARQRANKKK